MFNHHPVDNRIIEGDCTEVLRTLPAQMVDLVVTDPPYGVRYVDRTGRSIANDDDPERILGAFVDVYRVLKPDTFCISFYGWQKVDSFLRAWRRAGFRAVGHLVWHKSYASRVSWLAAHHEQAYLLAKGVPPKPARPLKDVQPWMYSGNRRHPTEKAVAILKPLIESFSPPTGLVLDPFAGSGSTLEAAATCGRRYLGVELDPAYCALIRQRLDAVIRPTYARRDAASCDYRALSRVGGGEYDPHPAGSQAAVDELLASLRQMNCESAVREVEQLIRLRH